MNSECSENTQTFEAPDYRFSPFVLFFWKLARISIIRIWKPHDLTAVLPFFDCPYYIPSKKYYINISIVLYILMVIMMRCAIYAKKSGVQVYACLCSVR